MKKFWVIPVLAALVCTGAAGCSASKKGEVQQGDMTVFPVSSTGDVSYSVGDVMPFYDNGVMNIYHLQNSRGSLSMYYHPISRLTTTDFLHYTDEGVAIDYEEVYSSPDAALGTGSFIKDNEGNYHCFYTGHNAAEDTGLPYYEAVRHAVSYDNQKTWEKLEFSLYGDANDFRDPYVYYDGYDECYYMIVTTQINGKGVIKRYSATTLNATDEEWRDMGVFFENDDGSYNMECPSYIEYNGYFYLAYSEQGDNRVTHYRYKSDRDGGWIKPANDSIDSSGFYAGRLEKTDDGLYAFAWCAKLTGGSTGEFDWGGNLVTHEMKQLSNGELCAVMVSEVKAALSNPVDYRLGSGDKLNGFNFDGQAFKSYAAEELSGNITRMQFTVSVNGYGGDFGLTFGLDGAFDNRLSQAVIAFTPASSSIACYNNVSSIIRYGSAMATVPFVFATGKNYNVEVLIDGEVLTVYCDETVALTARFPNIGNKNFAFYSNGASVQFGGIKLYE